MPSTTTLPAPSRHKLVDKDGLITREWLNYLSSLQSDVTTATDAAAEDDGGDIDASRLVGEVPLETIVNLTDENISPAAAIQWSKISKIGSSIGDFENRDAALLEQGTLPGNVDFTKDLGAGQRSGTFDIAVVGFTVGQNVTVVQTAQPIASKGDATDEFEMDAIIVTGYVYDTITIRCHWFSANGSVCVGTYAFAYGVNG